MATNGAVEGTGDPSVSLFQTEKALSCHLVIKHTPYKTSRQRTNPVTSDTTANCCRFHFWMGHTCTHEGHHHTLGHGAQAPSAFLWTLGCGIVSHQEAEQLVGPGPGYHFCSSVLLQSGRGSLLPPSVWPLPSHTHRIPCSGPRGAPD